MSPELEIEYKEIFDCLGSEGWKLILKNFEELRDSLIDVRNVDTEKQLHYIQGQLSILTIITNLQDGLEKEYETRKTEEELNGEEDEILLH